MSTRRRFTAVVVEAAETDSDELAARLGAGSLGTEFVPAGAGRVGLRIYFDTRAAAAAAASVLPAERAARLESVEDERWVERYQEALEPFPLGGRFEVQPSAPRPPAPGRIALRLVPGRAFGTGEHPTTRLVAQALERRVEAGSRWLDLGCGSGILSLVAARLGAGRVLAVDVDPEAVDVATEVVRANGLAPRVEVAPGSIEMAGPEPWDGIAANVETPFFLGRAAALARSLRRGGWLLASGIPVAEADEVGAALGRDGFEVVERAADDGWVVLVARRREAGGA